MDLHTWLKDRNGKTQELASLLGIERTNIWFWRKTGVPLRHMQACSDFTGGEVSVAAMLAHKHAVTTAADSEPAKVA